MSEQPRRARWLRPGQHLLNVLTGLRQPIVLLLLIIAFMATISGKPLDGVFMLVAGVSLAWDTGRRAREHAGAVQSKAQPAPTGTGPGDEAAPSAGAADERGGLAGHGQAAAAAIEVADTGATTRLRRAVLIAAGVACGVLYALVTGSFTRFSWPATVPVVALGVTVVALGWRGPRRIRPEYGPLPVLGTAAWGAILVAGGLWELFALLQQPNLTTGSYAHPTISTLTDPALATGLGRAVVLVAWLGLGWFLVER